MAKRRKGTVRKTVKGQPRRKAGQQRPPLELDLKEGTLTNYVKRNYGEEGFTERGTIRRNVLVSIKRGDKNPKGNTPNTTTKKRANFALVTKKWKKGKQ